MSQMPFNVVNALEKHYIHLLQSHQYVLREQIPNAPRRKTATLNNTTHLFCTDMQSTSFSHSFVCHTAERTEWAATFAPSAKQNSLAIVGRKKTRADNFANFGKKCLLVCTNIRNCFCIFLEMPNEQKFCRLSRNQKTLHFASDQTAIKQQPALYGTMHSRKSLRFHKIICLKYSCSCQGLRHGGVQRRS